MNDRDAWDLCFVTCVGWQLHPGYLRNDSLGFSVDECADFADEMMRVRSERWPDGVQR